MMEEEGFPVTSKPWLRKCILITGECGVGKTWVMRQLLTNEDKTYKLGKFNFHENDDWIIVGKYDGSTFQGSDRLSMSVMTDLDKMLKYIERTGKLAVFEGDRFSNSKFIERVDPVIIRILGDGEEGRKRRGSRQSERHLKSIRTRVNNLPSHRVVANSTGALNALKLLSCEHSK